MQSEYDINHLAREAQSRWLKPVEVFSILQNYKEHQLHHEVPQKPASGSLYLFNKRVVKFFRKDGHRWRTRMGQRTIAEAHERLKVGNVEALNCYYARGEENPNFQRRSYWILHEPYDHIVLVHYRDTAEGRQNARSTSEFSPLASSTFSHSPNFLATQQPESSFVIGESYELFHNESSPSSVEISSTEVTRNHVMNQLDVGERSNNVNSSSVPDLGHALRRLEQQLSLNDDHEVKVFNSYIENEDSNDFDALREYDLSGQISYGSDNLISEQNSGNGVLQHHQRSGVEIWDDIPDSSENLRNIESQAPFGGQKPQNSSLTIAQEVDYMKYPTYSGVVNAYGIYLDSYSLSFDHTDLGISLEDNTSLTIAQKKKFTIREISPDWCYTSEGAKVIIVGSFLCDASDSEWACMFGDTEVPFQIIQEGVISCHAPPHLHGNVSLCITSGNRESCSEVRDFEYRSKPNVCRHSNPLQTEADKSPDELLLLVKFIQMLKESDLPPKENNPESRVDLFGKTVNTEDPCSQITDALLDGTSTSSSTLDWLMQELLKDKLQMWLSSRLQDNSENRCSLTKKEQGIIHMIAGLGFTWALQPILNTGVSVNFRDINGWTALHWAAKFGRERMVAALIASGASAGAVTDPYSQDPNGKTPASVASTSGHMGLAGYLSEVALTSHLSSLTLEENELSKGSAAVEAEKTLNSLSDVSSSTNEDQVSLKDTLSAVRNAAQAAARIQSAFRAHSFLRRQQREVEVNISSDYEDEYGLLQNDIPGLSAASKSAFGNARDYNTSALSIQKKYRGWKGRKDFLTFRQKVVKIQAHVRGYQVRKDYKVCWAVGILDKVVLRWRRRGVGLRGFRLDSEFIDQTEDEDILKVFRKQKMDPAIDEAVSRVLSMIESPEARQQYHRLLEKYRQAKAELQNTVFDTSSSSNDHDSSRGISYMEK